MTTTCLTPATQTSPRFDRIVRTTTIRTADRQPTTSAARRFLSALLNSLSAWTV